MDPYVWRRQLPEYLADATARAHEIRALSQGATKGYFLPPHSDPYASTMLQGDGWGGCAMFVFESGQKKVIKGAILSNSCDISHDNQYDRPPNVTFAPLIKLSSLRTAV